MRGWIEIEAMDFICWGGGEFTQSKKGGKHDDGEGG